MPSLKCKCPAMWLSGLAGILLSAGCAGLGTPVPTTPLPESTPRLESILDELDANDIRLSSFRAAGTITLQAPSLEGVQRFPTGTVAYQRPDKLFVEGRLKTNAIAFQLQSSGDEFLIEFPTVREVKDRYFYHIKGQKIEDVPFDVSPSEVIDEMFLPEDWGSLKVPRDARITAFDPASQTATFTVGPRHRIRRTVVVSGPPWRVTRSERYDDEGGVLAITGRSEYNEKDGVQFPASIQSEFPQQGARMTFDMRNIRINIPLEPSLFIIQWRPAQ
ncbi:MAG: hypothetical protein AMXMBFR84_34340 [Candidatus Hydrogenedentota bacterium]